MCSVISVNDKRLPGNTKKWTLVRSWLIRVRLVHSWAVPRTNQFTRKHKSLDFLKSPLAAPFDVKNDRFEKYRISQLSQKSTRCSISSSMYDITAALPLKKLHQFSIFWIPNIVQQYLGFRMLKQNFHFQQSESECCTKIFQTIRPGTRFPKHKKFSTFTNTQANWIWM